MKDWGTGGVELSFAQGDVQRRLPVETLSPTPTLRLQPANRNAALRPAGTASAFRSSLYCAFGKPLLDRFLVLLSLPVTLPVILFCAIALWLEGGRPFYTQPRLGRDGRVFRILKLRTMVRDADQKLAHYLAADPAMRQEWDETQKLKNDPRITPVGRLLRAASLDELPQLWNVFKGDMSLVGPRPMMPDQLPLYGNPQSYFALRPGITGVWQVSVRNEGSFASRVEADGRYLNQRSLMGDLKLIWRTVGVVLKGTGY